MSNRGRKSTSGLKKASVKDSRSTAAKKGKENNSIKGKISQATRNGATKNGAKNKAEDEVNTCIDKISTTDMLRGRTLRQSDNKPDVHKPDLSFMDDFNPENSKREQRKNKEKLAVMNKEKRLDDKNGLLISNQKDLCDCM